MGRIAELFEKKAEGTITEEELKELTQLQKEAAVLNKEEETQPDKPKPTNEEPEEEEEDSPEKAVEALATRFAESASKKLNSVNERMEKILSSFESFGEGQHVTTSASGKGYIFDAALGKKVSVEELSKQKVEIAERKVAGKKHTEVTMRTYKFLLALKEKNVEKLQVLSEGVAGDGGYLVPEEFANLIIEDIRDIAIMRTLATVIPMTTDTLHIPSLTSRPEAKWRNEKTVKSTSTANFGENVLTPYSLAAIVGLSNELVADATLGMAGSIVNYIAGLIAQDLVEKEEKAFWTGSGSGQPTGVDGGTYSLRSVSGGLSDATRADAIVSAFFRTPQGYRNRGVWVANASTWEKINQLKDGFGNYLVSNLAGSPTPTLKGRPIYEQNDLAGGTLLYGMFSYYYIADREGLSVRVSDEATVAGQSAFERNLTFIRVEKRVDGELLLPAAVTKVTSLGTP
jgi:HK97 family phage major capsid protein